MRGRKGIRIGIYLGEIRLFDAASSDSKDFAAVLISFIQYVRQSDISRSIVLSDNRNR